MRKSYLFIYSNKVGSRSRLKDALNSMSEVLYWRYELEHSFFIISEHSASELSEAFKEAIGHSSGRFLFSEITRNKQGWLTSKAWHLINKKTHKPKNN